MSTEGGIEMNLVAFWELPNLSAFGLTSPDGSGVSICRKVADCEYEEGVWCDGTISFQNHSKISPDTMVLQIRTY